MMRIIHTLQVNRETILSIIFTSECALLTGQTKHQLTDLCRMEVSFKHSRWGLRWVCVSSSLLQFSQSASISILREGSAVILPGTIQWSKVSLATGAHLTRWHTCQCLI